MATVTQLYNHTVNRFNTGANGTGDTYKIMLGNGFTFSGSHTTLASVKATGTEVYGNGWDLGGEAITPTWAVATTDGASWTFDELIVAIAGGSLGPFDSYVIFNETDTDDPPVALVTMESALTVTAGNSASIKPPSGGLIVWAV